MRILITDRAIMKLEPRVASYEIYDSAGAGLSIIVHPTGRKVWAWRGRIRGRSTKLTLGTYPTHTVKGARVWSSEITEARDRDILRWPQLFYDQIEQQKAAQLLEDAKALIKHKDICWLFDLYMKREGGILRSAKTKVALFDRNVSPLIGSANIFEVSHNDLMDILYAKMPHAPSQANQTRVLIRRLFRWAVTRGGSEVGLDVNPAQNLYKLAKNQSRDRFLDDNELVLLVAVLHQETSHFAAGLWLILNTGVRRNEAYGAHWNEFDLTKARWTIPAVRYKTAVTHIIPIPELLLCWLKDRKLNSVVQDGPVFPSKVDARKPLTGYSRQIEIIRSKVKKLANAKGISNKDWTIHDLRRSVATGMQGLHLSDDKAPIPSDIVERILGHKLGGVRGTYNRYSYLAEKRAALRIWERHLRDLELSAEDLIAVAK